MWTTSPGRSSGNRRARGAAGNARGDASRAGKKSAGAGPVGSRSAGETSYWHLSTRPLHVLAFLAPFLCFYELGTLLFLSRQGVADVVRARELLSHAFDLFGAASFHLPPILLGVILVCWHYLSHDATRVRARVLAGMGAESVFWALPLLLFALLAGSSSAFLQAGGAVQVASLSAPAKATLALGAGVYEELVFRLVLISAAHLLLVDVFKVRELPACIVAACLSAFAFAFYHNVRLPTGGVDTRLVFIYVGAGAYFAVLYITRGFGVVVATHAVYDLIALLLLHGE